MKELYLTPKRSFQRNRARSNIMLYATPEGREGLQRKKKSNDIEKSKVFMLDKKKMVQFKARPTIIKVGRLSILLELS